MTDDLVKRLADLDPVLETDFDTQIDVERDPYGATQAIEMALYLLRDQADRIEALTAQLTTARADYQIESDLREVEEALLKAAEAERDRLRKLLEAIIDEYNGHMYGPTMHAIEAARSELDKANGT